MSGKIICQKSSKCVNQSKRREKLRRQPFFGRHQRQIQRQSGDHSQEYLANFGYKLNMKVIYKKLPSIFLATCLKLV
jgi:hypothetical protein